MNYSELKRQIKNSKLPRKEIALGANVTPKTIDNILAGSDFKVSTLEALCRVIGIKISVLFDEEQSMEIRQAGRDYVERGKIEHSGTEYNGSGPIETDLRDQIAQLKSQLADKERIIKLLEEKKMGNANA